MTLTQITEKGIKDGEIVNADINTSAGILKTKIEDFVSGNTNNRLLTATGSTNSLQGEANLNYDGHKLQITTDAATEGIRIVSTGDIYNDLVFGSNRSSSSTHLGRIVGEWNGGQVASIAFNTGSDTTAKDDGFINFQTSDGGSNMLVRMHIAQDGKVGIPSESPTARLQVSGAYNEVGAKIYGGGANYSDIAQFLTANGLQEVTIDGSGKVGIGIAQPGQLLHLSRSSTTAYSASSTANDTTLMVQNTGAAGHATIEMQVKSSGTSQTGQATIGAFTEAASSRATSLSFGTRNASSAMEERMRINSSGFVGTYRTNPKGSLHTSNREIVSSADPTTSADPNATYDGLIVDGEAASIINLRSRGDGNASYAGLFFSDNVRAAGQFLYQHKDASSDTDYFQYKIGGSEIARLNVNGLKLSATKGVDFSAYGAGATVSSNLLDDYEEGTWTPSYTVGSGGGNMVNNASYNATGGVYTKVGKLVLFTGRIQLNSGFTVIGGHVVINGLPFNSHNNINGVQSGGTFGYRAALGTNAVEMYIGGGSNQIQFYTTDGSVYYAGAGGNNFANTLHFWGCYHAA